MPRYRKNYKKKPAAPRRKRVVYKKTARRKAKYNVPIGRKGYSKAAWAALSPATRVSTVIEALTKRNNDLEKEAAKFYGSTSIAAQKKMSAIETAKQQVNSLLDVNRQGFYARHFAELVSADPLETLKLSAATAATQGYVAIHALVLMGGTLTLKP